MQISSILRTDSYKFTHHLQYPPVTKRVYSYIESRGGIWPQTVFFGLQMFLRRLEVPITQDDIDYAAARVEKHFGRDDIFDRRGWEYILHNHGGLAPVIIKAIPEGTVVPTGMPLVTIENTDTRVAWITSFLETAMHRAVWYPTTVATNSYHCKQELLRRLEETCDDPASVIPFALHDFGARGVSSGESAGIGGCAHLVNFLGTDTVEALEYAKEYYDEDMAGFSIPAAEHSTMTAWGRDREVDAYRNMLARFGGEGKILAVVSDSYDIYHAVSEIWCKTLKGEVLASKARVVIRPDSGDPVRVLPVLLQMLSEGYGHTVNSKGYKVLHPSVRLIWGDGIDQVGLPSILAAIVDAGFSTENVAFGMGGGLLQKVNRDDLKFAMKCSWAETDRGLIDVYKDPVTDPAKASKRGRLAVIAEGDGYQTVEEWGNGWRDHLKRVFRDGLITKSYRLFEVRANAARGPLLAS